MVGGRKCFGPDNADPSESFITTSVSDSTNHIQSDWDFDTDKKISQTDAITDETYRLDKTEAVQSIHKSADLNADCPLTKIAFNYASEKLAKIQDKKVVSDLMAVARIHIQYTSKWIKFFFLIIHLPIITQGAKKGL